MNNLNAVTVIVPVYGDWPSLQECIESLKRHVSPTDKVMLVNDCGPDADVIERNIKESIKNHDNFSYYRNPKNLGFVKNCNRAVYELDNTANDILLLNSDTKVTRGFLTTMKKVLNADTKHGVVTPRSNNATLATIPLYAASKKGISTDKSFLLYSRIKDKLPEYYQVPTAHGFCMLIRRSLIKKYGLFDEVFGKGYGEEVDFCRRIQAKGFKCLLSNKSYVFHLEARSFTHDTKNKLLEQNNRIIWERYPEYRNEVRTYMEVHKPEEARHYPLTHKLSKPYLQYKFASNQKIKKLAKGLR